MQQEFIAATELQQKLERAGQVFQPGRLELDLGQDIEPQWPVPCLQIEGISDVQAQQEATQQAETVMQSGWCFRLPHAVTASMVGVSEALTAHVHTLGCCMPL